MTRSRIARSRRGQRLLATTTLLLGLLAGLWALSGARRFQLFGELLWRGQTTEKVVALTFDDGPDAAGTDVLLDVLADRRVAATFFLVGREMAARPDLARRIAAAGHQLGNHSWSHARMLLRSPDFIKSELAATDAQIRAAGWTGPIHFRPPYGKRLLLLPWILSAQQRLTVMWDIEPESDPAIEGNADAIVTHVLERVRPGSIILLHPMYRSRTATRAAVPRLIDALKARGWRFVTVDELRALNPPS